MRAVGQVIEQRSGYARVALERPEGCGGCGQCGPQQAASVILALNALRAPCGARVELEIDDRAAITAALLVFLLPLVGLAGGIVFSRLTAWWFALPPVNVQDLLSAATGFVIGLLPAARYERTLRPCAAIVAVLEEP